MGNLLKSVHLLEDKLEVLLSNYEFLQRENEVLMQENNRLQVLIQEKEQLVSMYKDDLKSLKIAKAIEGSTKGIRDTKLKINALIREIDKCIVQLNS